MIGVLFQHFIALIPTQGPTLSWARDLGGKAEEKQTQTRTEEEIPQGLSGIGKEVRQYLECNPLQICTRCQALRRASPLWLSTSGSITQGSVSDVGQNWYSRRRRRGKGGRRRHGARHSTEKDVSDSKTRIYTMSKALFWCLFHCFAMIYIRVWHLNIQLYVKLVCWEYSTLGRQ